MIKYGLWPETIQLSGQTWPAELVDRHYAVRAGFAKIYAVNGLPEIFARLLASASQVCEMPHTWRVRECQNETEVTEDLIVRGIAVLESDQKNLGAHIITYVGDRGDGAYEFLAAGAIRDKLTRDYQNPEYPVVSRAIVAPAHRGKGLGSLIVEHRFKAALNFFPQKPKAIHFGTESEKILHAVHKVERDEGIKFVHIGNEEYMASDATHTVKDYLCFMPWFQQELLKACDVIANYVEALEFKKRLNNFMASGIEGVSGAWLETTFQKLSDAARAIATDSAELDSALQQVNEIFIVKSKIGAADPR